MLACDNRRKIRGAYQPGVAEFKDVAALGIEHLDKRRETLVVARKLRRKLKQDRTGFWAPARDTRLSSSSKLFSRTLG